MDGLVLDSLTVAVMAIDKNFTITVANKMCKTILGIEPSDAIGQHIDVFFNYPPEFTRTVQHSLEQEKDFRYDIFPYTWGTYDKTLSQRSTLLRNDHGQVVGAMIEFEDITERYNRDTEYQKFMEEGTVNILPIDEGIGMLVIQSLPFDISHDRFQELGAAAMNKATDMKLQYLVLDASTLPTVRMVANILPFRNLVEGFKLIGVKVLMAGIRPDVAVQVNKAGIEMGGIQTFTHMNQALTFLRKKGSTPNY